MGLHLYHLGARSIFRWEWPSSPRLGDIRWRSHGDERLEKWFWWKHEISILIKVFTFTNDLICLYKQMTTLRKYLQLFYIFGILVGLGKHRMVIMEVK